MNLGEMLSKKYAGVPGILWLLGGGAVVYFVLPRLGLGQSSSGTSGAAGPGVSTVPITVPEFTPSPPGAPPTTPTSTDTPLALADWKTSGSGFAYLPSGQDGTFTKGGQQYYHLTGPGAADAYVNGGGQTYFFPAPGVPVPYSWPSSNAGVAGGTYIYGVITVPTSTGGTGGGVGGPSVSSRTASPMHYSHPSIKAPTRFPHYVVGGNANRGQTVRQIAAHSGVHPARLIALNRELHPDRPIPRGTLVRIA